MTTTEYNDAIRNAERVRFAQEAVYCERILAKSGDNIVTATLAHINEPTFWTHYPVGDVFDPETGAHWYYHSHAPDPTAAGAQPDSTPVETKSDIDPADNATRARIHNAEHGHFHCFVRPQSKAGPIHHLVALSVDAHGTLQSLFTVGQHVVNDDPLSVDERIQLLDKFDVQLSRPNYLVNRWVTAIIGLYQDEITRLIQDGDACAATNKAIDVTAELKTSLAEKIQTLEGFPA